MYDVKPEVFQALKTIPDVAKIVDSYPTSFAEMPLISFYEQTNRDEITALPGVLTNVTIQIDVWHNQSTGDLARAVNAAMNALGLRREFAADLNETGIKRKTMRYRGIVDSRTNHVNQ